MANETLTFRPSKKNETILSQLAELAEQENRSLEKKKLNMGKNLKQTCT